MGNIDFTALKNKRKAIEDKVEEEIPTELEQSYTEVWGSNKESILYIETTRLVPFVDKEGNSQPFRLNEKKIEQIAASAKDIGIVTPLTVRAKGDIYEIIAGHHRLEAAKRTGQLKVPCIVRRYTDEEMFIVLAESNIQRDRTLPSEYAKIFSKYMAIRNDEEVTAEEIAAKFDVSKKTMYRYLNVGRLVPELQEMTDERKINVAAAELLTQLSEDEQIALYFVISETGDSVSVQLAKQLIEAAEASDEVLTEERINEVIENNNAAPKSKQHSISSKIITKYFSSANDDEIERTLQKALELYFSQQNGNS